MSQEDALPPGILRPTAMFHWKLVLAPELGSADLLVSGKSPESRV